MHSFPPPTKNLHGQNKVIVCVVGSYSIVLLEEESSVLFCCSTNFTYQDDTWTEGRGRGREEVKEGGRRGRGRGREEVKEGGRNELKEINEGKGITTWDTEGAEKKEGR